MQILQRLQMIDGYSSNLISHSGDRGSSRKRRVYPDIPLAETIPNPDNSSANYGEPKSEISEVQRQEVVDSPELLSQKKEFLLKLAKSLQSSGCPTQRLEYHIKMAGKSLGIEATAHATMEYVWISFGETEESGIYKETVFLKQAAVST